MSCDALQSLLTEHLDARPGESVADCLMRRGVAAEHSETLAQFVAACDAVMVDTSRERACAEERLALAIRSSGMGLWEWELVTEEITVDGTWRAALGFEDDEIDGDFSHWLTRIDPLDVERFRSCCASICAATYRISSCCSAVPPRQGIRCGFRPAGGPSSVGRTGAGCA